MGEEKGKKMMKGKMKGKAEREIKRKEIPAFCVPLQYNFMCISVRDQFLFPNIYICYMIFAVICFLPHTQEYQQIGACLHSRPLMHREKEREESI